ncbi:RNA polymerase factor sigma-54 [Clostridium subterminale]|uniref:RNA polymerase factor sigma-54 n=1 Tax=Clostridium subterminale TaxID=1550 RepID=A0ABN1KTM4_CLOSU
MNLGFDLRLSQEQKLIMTMEMQQSIKLLQMSSYELLQHIDKELQENVVLEVENNLETPKDEIVDNELREYRELIRDMAMDNYNDRSYYKNEENDLVSPFNFISSKPTIKDYLREQVMHSNLDRRDEYICRYIVDNIDHRGYLDEKVTDGLIEELSISKDAAIRCIDIVQGLEPPGICARSLSECLIIQLRRKNIMNSYVEEIINNYLYELSKGKYQLIGKKLGVTAKMVQGYEDIIKKLEPKPTRGFFTGEEIGYLIPDVYIKKVSEEYVVLMNDNLLPNLMINNTYKDVINSSNDSVAIDYVKDKISSAMFLIKSIQNRKNTLCRVVEEIVKNQREYLDKGNNYIKPMTIKYIANSLNVHESTVGRAIRDKYVALHTGEIKRIKDLFTNSVNVLSQGISCVSVKDMIKNTIESEDKSKPLSDSAICKIVNEKGIDISRRTVAKYREELGIKASSQRKRLT